MQIRTTSDPYMRSRGIHVAYETEQRSTNSTKIFALLTGILITSAMIAGVYFYPQLQSRWDNQQASTMPEVADTPQPVSSMPEVSAQEADALSPAINLRTHSESLSATESDAATAETSASATAIQAPIGATTPESVNPAGLKQADDKAIDSGQQTIPAAASTAAANSSVDAEAKTAAQETSSVAAVDNMTTPVPNQRPQQAAEAVPAGMAGLTFPLAQQPTEPVLVATVDTTATTASATAEPQQQRAPVAAETNAPTVLEPVPEPAQLTNATAPATREAADPAATETAPSNIVDTLVAKAEQQIARTRLTLPSGDNAYETYQSLLEQDPAKAAEVLESILSWYLDQGSRYVEEGKIDGQQGSDAVDMYKRMQGIAADHNSTEQLLEKMLNGLQEKAQEQAKQGHLLYPKGNNAYATYQRIQQLAPGHPAGKVALQAVISGLTRIAEQQIKRRHYTLPKNDNAYDTYKTLLRLDPNNKHGLAGIEKLVNIYYNLALQKRRSGNYTSSLAMIKRGLNIAPNHRNLLRLQKNVNARLNDPYYALVRKAERQLAAGNVLQPAGDNAYETYQQMRASRPNASETRTILQQIGNHYHDIASQQYYQDDIQASLSNIEQGLKLAPQHDGLKQLKLRVQNLIVD